MDFLRLLGLALAATAMLVVVRRLKPEIALILSLAAGVILLLLVLPRLTQALHLLSQLTARAGVQQLYLQAILKVLGISYLAEFGSQVAKDAGEAAMAANIELVGKILIMVMAIPIINALLTTVLRLIT